MLVIFIETETQSRYELECHSALEALQLHKDLWEGGYADEEVVRCDICFPYTNLDNELRYTDIAAGTTAARDSDPWFVGPAWQPEEAPEED